MTRDINRITIHSRALRTTYKYGRLIRIDFKTVRKPEENQSQTWSRHVHKGRDLKRSQQDYTKNKLLDRQHKRILLEAVTRYNMRDRQNEERKQKRSQDRPLGNSVRDSGGLTNTKFNRNTDWTACKKGFQLEFSRMPKCLERRSSRIWWSTTSKATLKSSETTQVNLPLSKAIRSLRNLTSAVSVEKLFWKAQWKGDRRENYSI